MGSTTFQNYQVAGADTRGTLYRGAIRQVIGDGVATRSLVQKESGALCLFDLAAGVVYTLPPPVIGTQFEFLVTVSVTSNAHKIITDAATTFLLGETFTFTTATASGAGFAFNGTTHRALSAAGSTTGGLIGERYSVTAISSTVWAITGFQVGSGTIATAAATS